MKILETSNEGPIFGPGEFQRSTNCVIYLDIANIPPLEIDTIVVTSCSPSRIITKIASGKKNAIAPFLREQMISRSYLSLSLSVPRASNFAFSVLPMRARR